ncbi:MAG: sel1 repeat family protein [Lachnospiraceae bacterium]|nr:sel1 repeat family protein [Lachnospiraceae bacterium]MBQ7781192.1 sel1 repeat family protein [Lachnospiraceae bacterium]
MLSAKELKKYDKQYEKIITDLKAGKDKAKLRKKMDKLAHAGHPKACLFIRAALLNGVEQVTSQQDKANFLNAANNLLKIAADNGDVDCQYAVAARYEKGDGFPKSDRDAFFYYHMAARNGDAKAQTNVGRYYSLGIGAQQNRKEAIYWFEQAANQGETIAMINMANGYENGKGVPKDNQKAIDWYTKALENARRLLATGGQGMKEYSETNEQKGIELATQGLRRMDIQIQCEEYRAMQSEYLKEITLKKIRQYADEGEWRAQFEMGLISENEKNYEEAIRWYTLASDNGSSGAMRNIGLIYYYGKGRAVDYKIAYEWFMKAIHHAANTHAMYMVGEMYEKGLYVPKNTDTAISWYKKADMQGSPEARGRLQTLINYK